MKGTPSTDSAWVAVDFLSWEDYPLCHHHLVISSGGGGPSTTSQRIHPENNEDDEYGALAFSIVIRATVLFFQTLVTGDSGDSFAIPVIQEYLTTFRSLRRSCLPGSWTSRPSCWPSCRVAREAEEVDKDVLKKARKMEQGDSLRKVKS